MIAVGVQVGSAGVADQQGVSGEHEPRVLAAGVVCDQVGVVRERMPRRRDRPDLGFPKLDGLAVGDRVMLELDP